LAVQLEGHGQGGPRLFLVDLFPCFAIPGNRDNLGILEDPDVMLGGLLGLVVEPLLLRRLRGRHLEQVLLTIGVSLVVVIQEALLGVRPVAPAWASFDVRPPLGGLAAAAGRVPTPRGPVLVSWRRGNGGSTGFALDVTVPPNASADVYVPANGPDAVAEGDRSASTAPGVRFERMDGEAAVFAVAAGSYSFRAAATTSGPGRHGSPPRLAATGATSSLAGFAIVLIAAALLACSRVRRRSPMSVPSRR